MVASRRTRQRPKQQNTIIVATRASTVVFKQIAGLIARRIVCYKKPGDSVRGRTHRTDQVRFARGCSLGPGMGDGGVSRASVSAAGSSILARRRVAANDEPKDRLIDPQSPDRRPRRAAYALPTLFTAAEHFPRLRR